MVTVRFILGKSLVLTLNDHQSVTILNEPGRELETLQNQGARLQELCANEMTGLQKAIVTVTTISANETLTGIKMTMRVAGVMTANAMNAWLHAEPSETGNCAQEVTTGNHPMTVAGRPPRTETVDTNVRLVVIRGLEVMVMSLGTERSDGRENVKKRRSQPGWRPMCQLVLLVYSVVGAALVNWMEFKPGRRA
jgi:hypothetical protein